MKLEMMRSQKFIVAYRISIRSESSFNSHLATIVDPFARLGNLHRKAASNWREIHAA